MGDAETRRRGDKERTFAPARSFFHRVNASPAPRVSASSFRLHPCFLLLILTLFFIASCVPEDERYKEIRPGIKATASGVEVTNKDSFNYPKVTVYLNGNFETFVGDIPAGKTVSLPFEKFTDGGTRFDISARKLRYIRVKAMFGKNASDINFEVH